MTFSEYLVFKGLDIGPKGMSEITKVPKRTLEDWYKSDTMRPRFDSILRLVSFYLKHLPRRPNE